MKRRHQKKGRMIGLAVLVLVVLVALAILWQRPQKEESKSLPASQNTEALEEKEESEASKKETETTPDSEEKDKTETVHVQADATGNVQEITVEARLRNKGGSGKISDYSELEEIKNTKGDEEFTQAPDGTLLWENHGEDIYYEGKSQKELPVNVKVSYYLEGQQINPQELAGKSGAVRIRLDYENHTSQKVTVEDKELEMPVPFGVFSAVMLPEDVFSNVQVKNGKAMDMEGQKIVLGYAFPGLQENLKLGEYEPTEELEIPDYVEITADVTDFALDFTATVVTSGIFEDLDTKDLEEADELTESSDEMKDASKELMDGADKLLDGLGTFRSYMEQYTTGVSSASDGSKALADGLKTLNEKKAEVLSGAEALQEGLESLNTALVEISLPKSQGMEGMEEAANALAADAQTVSVFLTSLQETLEKTDSFCGEARAYQSQVDTLLHTVREQLQGISFAGAEQTATEMARSQARSALMAALAGTELSEEEKARICDSTAAGIQISGIIQTAQEQLSQAVATLGNVPALEIPEIAIDSSVYQETVTDMQKQLGILAQYSAALSGMGESFSGMSTALTALKSGTAKLKSGSGQLTEGIEAFNQGIEKVYEGAVALSGGTQQLQSAGASLGTGLDTLTEGMRALSEGLETFDEEGIQKLAELAGEDLENLITRVKAMKEADGLYENYSGLASGQSGSVKFIIETEEIEKD